MILMANKVELTWNKSLNVSMYINDGIHKNPWFFSTLWKKSFNIPCAFLAFFLFCKLDFFTFAQSHSFLWSVPLKKRTRGMGTLTLFKEHFPLYSYCSVIREKKSYGRCMHECATFYFLPVFHVCVHIYNRVVGVGQVGTYVQRPLEQHNILSKRCVHTRISCVGNGIVWKLSQRQGRKREVWGKLKEREKKSKKGSQVRSIKQQRRVKYWTPYIYLYKVHIFKKKNTYTHKRKKTNSFSSSLTWRKSESGMNKNTIITVENEK